MTSFVFGWPKWIASHSPLFRLYLAVKLFYATFAYTLLCLVGPSGLEPPTSCLSGTRSNHLSYEPVFLYASSWIFT